MYINWEFIILENYIETFILVMTFIWLRKFNNLKKLKC